MRYEPADQSPGCVESVRARLDREHADIVERGGEPRREGGGLIAHTQWRNESIDLVKPQSFMNVSGPVVAAAGILRARA